MQYHQIKEPNQQRMYLDARYKKMEKDIPKLVEIAKLYGEDPYNVIAHFMQESGGRSNAISTDKDSVSNYGYGQVRLGTATDIYKYAKDRFKEYGIPKVTRPEQLLDPVINAHYAIANRDRLRKQYGLTEPDDMLSGYRGGPGFGKKHKGSQEAKNSLYNRNIAAYEQQLRTHYPDIIPQEIPATITQSNTVPSVSIMDSLDRISNPYAHTQIGATPGLPPPSKQPIVFNRILEQLNP